VRSAASITLQTKEQDVGVAGRSLCHTSAFNDAALQRRQRRGGCETLIAAGLNMVRKSPIKIKEMRVRGLARPLERGVWHQEPAQVDPLKIRRAVGIFHEPTYANESS